MPIIFISYKLSFFIMVITSPNFGFWQKKYTCDSSLWDERPCYHPNSYASCENIPHQVLSYSLAITGNPVFGSIPIPKKNSKALFTKVSNIHFHQPGLSRFFPLATNLFIVVFVIILNYFIKVKG